MKTRKMRLEDPKRFISYRALQRVAVIMLPFYKAIARNGAYARRWSTAVVETDLDRMSRLLRAVTPCANGLPLGTNSIGYFVSFPAGESEWTNGTTIPPGTTQFVFEPSVHQAIARAVLPLYRELSCNRCFSIAFAKAIGMGEAAVVNRMVRSLVHTPALKSVSIGVEDGGIALTFKFKGSKYRYQNLLFRDKP